MENSSLVFDSNPKKDKDEKEGLIKELYSQIGELKVANDWLKKAALIPLENRKIMIDKDAKISITKQCKLLNINKSSFYYSPKMESQENLEIMEIMDKQYIKTPFYGTKKLLVVLVLLGYKINQKRLRRLDMQTKVAL